MRTFGLFVLGFQLLLTACTARTIAGTTVRATGDNEQIVDTLRQLDAALEARDAEALLALISPEYFEDMGTPDNSDDFGYRELRDRILSQGLNATKEMHVEFQIHEVVVEDDRAHADIRYKSRAYLDLPSGQTWDSHQEFNRIELVRVDGRWLILSGI